MSSKRNISANIKVKRKRRLNKRRFFTFLAILFIIVASILYFIFCNVKQFKNDNKAVSADNEPAVEIKNKKDVSLLKKDLEEYIKNYEGQYGIHYINLEDNTQFGINDTDVYMAASTIKIPINLYLYKNAKSGKINLDSKMIYNKSQDYEGGTGSIQYQKDGSTYSVKNLSELSIKISDNVATQMIIRLIGRQNFKDFMKQVGGTIVTEENVSCPKDMTIYMREVYNFYNTDKEFGKELMDNLCNTIFNDRIPKLIPKDVKIAHKTGNQVRAVHDVGIVFTEKPYIISIMSKDVDENEAYDVIANISKKVYDFVIDEKTQTDTQ